MITRVRGAGEATRLHVSGAGARGSEVRGRARGIERFQPLDCAPRFTGGPESEACLYDRDAERFEVMNPAARAAAGSGCAACAGSSSTPWFSVGWREGQASTK